MYVVCVKISVLPDRVQEFMEATLDNARGTREEPGNVRFDVLRAVDDPARFFLYEVYKDEGDFKAHQQTEHYLRWKERVAPMMAQPRVGEKYGALFPEPWT
ncbi:antibiotic biosynthesis monooxygenase [Polyangium aurulentum]|uniref:antibiotic biosynthesis monooxygenase n=1 Tax=Polyangium aurulentum TaxID=2567896 RepID=UPI0010ADF69B|nr:antibiotic biosynthesis monooxygenase [Polyangium aurulentum]UQA59158.1 antibiotic biosynthesis monooxygenase [Polyangium aurulentum]